ncbi:MAG: hypothetical protein JRD88_02720 [Deltaproteobacteria bacterium]|nr:hypothetical protein [Deltaproteobacteria bacterium]
MDSSWDNSGYQEALRQLDTLSYCVQTTKKDFPQLHTNLTSNHTLLLQLLERPDILEHKQLSGTLPATLHLKEELDHPPHFIDLPAADFDHLAGGIQLVYQALTGQWIDDIAHLQAH